MNEAQAIKEGLRLKAIGIQHAKLRGVVEIVRKDGASRVVSIYNNTSKSYAIYAK